MGFDRTWLESQGSEDCHGRALWVLGNTIGLADSENLRGTAVQIFTPVLPAQSANVLGGVIGWP